MPVALVCSSACAQKEGRKEVFNMDKRMIDYEKLITMLEERRAYYSMLSYQELENGGEDYLTYFDREFAVNEIISELKRIPF